MPLNRKACFVVIAVLRLLFSSISTDAQNLLSPPFDLPIRIDPNFKWGVNGHPIVQGSYFNSIGLQMDVLKELQAPYYRVDLLHLDENGTVPSVELAHFNELMSKAGAADIQVIPVMILRSDLYSLTPADAEIKGRALAAGFASRYGNYFSYYELGNEDDIPLITVPRTDGTGLDGTLVRDYDPDHLAVTCAYLRGMISGIKSVDPSAKTIVSGANHLLYYTLLLNEGVNFDILGYHYYWVNGYTDILHALSTTFAQKEVWFTEVNSYDAVRNNEYYPNLQDTIVGHFIQLLDQQTNIKGFFIYELFNEGYLTDSTREAKFGLIRIPYTAATSRQPLFYTYKLKIEETKRGWQDFIHSIYLYCNLREPDPLGLQYWTNIAASSHDIPGVIDNILPVESYRCYVWQLYRDLYDRNGDAAGVNNWTNQLLAGSTREQLAEIFCGSVDFWILSGSTNSGFISRLYRKLLNRSPLSVEVSSALNMLKNGGSRSSLAHDLLHSEEYYHIFVRAQYNALLRRNGNIDSISESWGVGLLDEGMTQLDFIKTLLNSYEFWLRGMEEGYVRNNPPFQFRAVSIPELIRDDKYYHCCL
ncbi:MAG: hypothetical protein BGO55_20140 [Sphingobacteriales bacterium 50-39]|nr:DUF4214 domain-containing protein [Sphingobacteriales bacterium]OJW59012.1 MAG: hypothetical protein BGO55_20140 [Sphingobacteriales bacterium 50-39]